MISANVLAESVVRVTKMGFFEVKQDFGAEAKRDDVGALISHVGDLVVSGTDSFISYISERLGNEYGVGVFEENESIYMGVGGVKKVPSEFTNRGNIPDGDQTFTCETVSYNDYEGGMRDISILPGSAKQTDEPLTESEQFALRSELVGLIWIARISRPCALYGASVSAQTC